MSHLVWASLSQRFFSLQLLNKITKRLTSTVCFVSKYFWPSRLKCFLSKLSRRLPNKEQHSFQLTSRFSAQSIMGLICRQRQTHFCDVCPHFNRIMLCNKALRPSNTNNIFRANRRATMLLCKLRWNVGHITTFLCNEFLCCEKKTSLLIFATWKFVAQGGNTRNKPSQLATQHCWETSCTKNVARIRQYQIVLFPDSLLLRPENDENEPGTQAGKERVLNYLQAHAQNEVVQYTRTESGRLFGEDDPSSESGVVVFAEVK